MINSYRYKTIYANQSKPINNYPYVQLHNYNPEKEGRQRHKDLNSNIYGNYPRHNKAKYHIDRNYMKTDPNPQNNFQSMQRKRQKSFKQVHQAENRYKINAQQQFIQNCRLNFIQTFQQYQRKIAKPYICDLLIDLRDKLYIINEQLHFGYQITIKQLQHQTQQYRKKIQNLQLKLKKSAIKSNALSNNDHYLKDMQVADGNLKKNIQTYEKLIEKYRKNYLDLKISIKIQQQNYHALLSNKHDIKKSKKTQFTITDQKQHKLVKRQLQFQPKILNLTIDDLQKYRQTKIQIVSNVVNYSVSNSNTNINNKQKDDNQGLFLSKFGNDRLIERHSLLFMGQVLDDCDLQKLKLKDQLQAIKRATIKKTKLLYRYDSRIKQNIHLFIDDRPNILLLCKSCYSQAAFSKTNHKMGHSSAFIFSLTNQKSFPILSGKKALSYDNEYVIFGNSELRVNGTTNKMFSNFGISNGYFDSKEQNVHTLLGQGNNRQIQYQNLQIFQIIFT